MKVVPLPLLFGMFMVCCVEASALFEPADLDDPENLKEILNGAIDQKNLEQRSLKGQELYYSPKKKTTYSGWSKEIHANGRIKSLVQVKEGKMNGLINAWYENGRKKAEGSMKDGQPFGLLKGWYENGHKRTEVRWSTGKLMFAEAWKPNGEKCPLTNLKDGNGAMVAYYENGQRILKENYKDGKKNGRWIRWYENGRNESEGNYESDKLDGLIISWHRNGQKEEEGKCKDGKEEGLWTKWFESGQKKEETNYMHGQLHGDGARWYQNGQKENEGNWKENKLTTALVWKPNGEKCAVTKIKEGNGVLVFYNDEGREKSRKIFKDGKADELSLQTIWNENGQKRMQGNFKDGKPHGLCTHWNSNGIKEGESSWKDGKKNGLWTWFFENGQKSKQGKYKEGKEDGPWEEWYFVDLVQRKYLNLSKNQPSGSVETDHVVLEALLAQSKSQESRVLQEINQFKRSMQLPFIEDSRLENTILKRRYIQEITNAKVEKVRISSLLRQILQIKTDINNRSKDEVATHETNASQDKSSLVSFKEFLKVDAIKNFGRIPALREKLFEWEQVERKLSRRTPVPQQDFDEAKAALGELQTTLELEVKASIEHLSGRHKRLYALEEEFESALERVQSESATLTEVESKLAELDRKLRIQRETTDNIQRRLGFTYPVKEQKKARIHWREGKQEGLSTQWHQNGRKKEEGYFKVGKKTGAWTYWSKTGQVEAQRNYENGLLVTPSPDERGQERENDSKKGKTDSFLKKNFPIASPI